MGTRLILVLAGCAWIACGQQNAVYDKPFIDIDSLLNQQVHQLVAQQARLHKTTEAGGTPGEKTWLPDSLQWAAEMEVFRQLDDVNRPGVTRQYAIVGKKDSLSNLQVVMYQAPDAPLTELALYFLPRPRQLKKIAARLQRSNPLFTASRAVALEFDHWQGQPRLARYHVQGFQKMVLGDSITYQISGTVGYPSATEN